MTLYSQVRHPDKSVPAAGGLEQLSQPALWSRVLPSALTLAVVTSLAAGGAWLLVGHEQPESPVRPSPAAAQASLKSPAQEPLLPDRAGADRRDGLRGSVTPAVITRSDELRPQLVSAVLKTDAPLVGTASGSTTPAGVAPEPVIGPAPLPVELVRTAMQNATPAVRPIPAAEVDQLIARSGTLISQGNIAGARLVLERAAAGRSGEALFRLAKTYDPAALAQWKAIGVKPDPDKARDLYRQAANLGVKDGPEVVALVAQSSLPSRPR
jgi:hypothetical protein